MPGGGNLKNRMMVINKIILFIVVLATRILSIALGIAQIPFALAYDALEAMSRRAEDISDNIMEEIKG